MGRLESKILEDGLGRNEIPEVVDESQFETELERSAYLFAKEVHKKQTRKEGNKPYITHLVSVWWILNYMGIKDPEIRIAGLLHDTIEDQGVTPQTLTEMFGERVYRLVEGVTELNGTDKALAEQKTKDKTLRSSGVDYGISAIKFADRLHNIRTLGAMPPEKRMAKAKHTLDFVVNLAMVYKMWDYAIMLQDLSFPHAYPEVWEEEAPKIAADPRLRTGFIEKRLDDLRQVMTAKEIDGDYRTVFGGYYRSYQSLLRNGSDYSSVNDLMSVEVVVKDEATCYKLLGALHETAGGGVVPNAFRDYLYSKTFDGYSALQTTMNFPGYGLVKYVITTQDRCDYNHRGVLATVEKEGGKHINLAKLVKDSSGRMVVLPDSGTVLDAAVALYPFKVGSAISFLCDGVLIDPSDQIPHGAELELVSMGRDDYSRFQGVKCSAATRHEIAQRKTVEERRVRSLFGKEKMDMHLRASRMGLFSLEDLVFVNGRGKTMMENLIAKFAGNRGTISDLYFALSRDYGVKPDEVVEWLRQNGFSKDELGLSTVYLEVKDIPGILHKLTGIIGQNGTGVNINQILQTEKKGQKGVVVLKFILNGANRKYEEDLMTLLAEEKDILNAAIV